MTLSDIVTIRVVLSPESENAPWSLCYKLLYADGRSEVKVTEKSYGLLIRGPKEPVDRITSSLRKIDPCGIFVTEAAPPIKGHKVFRNFLQLSGEMRTLPLITQALREYYDKNGSEPRATGRQVRCRYLEKLSAADYDAVVIDYGDGNVEVRCPRMIFHGYNICGLETCLHGKTLSRSDRETYQRAYRNQGVRSGEKGSIREC